MVRLRQPNDPSLTTVAHELSESDRERFQGIRSPAYDSLTSEQRQLVNAYLAHHCDIKATMQWARCSRRWLLSQLRNPAIREAIDELTDRDPLIASRDEVLQFWSATMRNRWDDIDATPPPSDIVAHESERGAIAIDPGALRFADRLKASENLARAHGMWDDRSTVVIERNHEVFVDSIAQLADRVREAKLLHSGDGNSVQSGSEGGNGHGHNGHNGHSTNGSY